MARTAPRFCAGLGALALSLTLGACGTSDPLDPADPVLLAEAVDAGAGPANQPTRSDRCDGTLGAETVEEIEVPAGATCVLEGTRVEGNVFVRHGATLEAYGAWVDGNIQAEDAALVLTAEHTRVSGDVQVKRLALASLVETTIDGNLQVEEWGASLDASGVVVGGDLQLKKAEGADIEDVSVLGDLQLEENQDPLSVTGSQIEGNLQVVKNRGGVTLVDNRVLQALQCDENRPAPVGSGNEAGEKEGQCSSL